MGSRHMHMLLLRLQVVLVVIALGRLGFATLALPFDAAASGDAACCACNEPSGDCDDCTEDCDDGDHDGGERHACAPGCADCHCCPAPLVAIVPTAAPAPALVRAPRAAPPHARGDRAAPPERIDRPPRIS